MMELLGVLNGVLLCIVVCLCVRIRMLQRSADEIAQGFGDCLTMDTNTLITLSSRDRHMRRLADAINRELRTLRRQRNRYLSGDRELREAITNISHDLRTPLTAICGYLELLEREEQSEAARRYLSIISGRAETMKELTQELFRYSLVASTADSLEMEDVCVSRVLEEAVAANYAALCSRGIEPEITMPEAPVVRRLNHAALSRVFANLISNALRHSDGDLSITLTEDGSVVFANAAQGLDEVQVGKLFDRFYTVESARRTTGLGLAIAKALTEQMGGQIGAQYADGRLVIRLRFTQ